MAGARDKFPQQRIALAKKNQNEHGVTAHSGRPPKKKQKKRKGKEK
jgi:hypothetical protein